MQPIYECQIAAPSAVKKIEVYAGDVLDFSDDIDILTTSAFSRAYYPTEGTMFHALDQAGISVMELSEYPLLDLREACGIWLSAEVHAPDSKIHRIGCVEMSNAYDRYYGIAPNDRTVLSSIKAYFQMLDIAATCGVVMDTIAMPILGAGRQNISIALTLTPILTECVAFLKRNDAVQRICFIERNLAKANMISITLKNSYLLHQSLPANESENDMADLHNQMAFISYSHDDKNVADNLCAKLERKGIKAWYAPRDVHGPYPAAIANAIGRATHFVVILSENCFRSEHVLNEIALAFEKLPNKIKFMPLRIDSSELTDSYRYYLTRQHWMDAIHPPLEARLEEFVARLIQEL